MQLARCASSLLASLARRSLFTETAAGSLRTIITNGSHVAANDSPLGRYHGQQNHNAFASTAKSPSFATAAGDKSDDVRLTQLSHGGGCGCKISPALLHEILSSVPLDFGSSNLLVGAATSDDAAVYKLNETQCLVLTTDFFMPIVDDARDFGRIAATNSISDVYAMGGTPILALSVLGMPIDKLSPAVIRRIIQGGADVCRQAGIPLAGGHSIDSPEPIFGLVVAGLVHPDHLRQNSTGVDGDNLILTKPLGTGVMTTALKRGKLDGAGYQQVLATMTQLNTLGAAVSSNPEVHAVTDVTGFGLLGHALEMARGSQLTAHVSWSAVPFMGPALPLAQAGVFPGAVPRNLESYGQSVVYPGSPDAIQEWQLKLLADPQTSGGLLLAVSPAATQAVLQQAIDSGCREASVIGRLHRDGAPGTIQIVA